MTRPPKGIAMLPLLCHGAATAIRLVASISSGALPVLAATVHGTADTIAQLFLLRGAQRVELRADARHPFGYGKEIYFWSFVVAVLLYGLGAGVALLAGAQSFLTLPPLLHPQPAVLPAALSDPALVYGALAAAGLLQAGALWAALDAAGIRGLSGLHDLRATRDPALLATVVEALAGLVGTLAAFLGVFAASSLGLAQAGGLSVLAIGLVMCAVSAFMALEIRRLILGEAASPTLRSALRSMIRSESNANGVIAGVNEVRTLQLGPDELLVAAGVAFEPGASIAAIEGTSARIEDAIRRAYPQVSEVFIGAQPLDPAAQRAALAADRAAAFVGVEGDESGDTSASRAYQAQGAAGNPPFDSRKSRKKKRRH